MTCSQCGTENPADHKFCRECGAKFAPTEAAGGPTHAVTTPAVPVPEVAVEDEHRNARVAALLTEALALSERKDTDGALARAEEAVTLVPTSTSAHTLLAALYERTGHIDRAVHAMETVVSLNPDSSADAEKLKQLRRGVRALPVRPRPSRAGKLPRWTPVAAAAGAAVLVLGVGLSLINDDGDAGQQRSAPRSVFPGPTTVVADNAAPAASPMVGPTPRPVLAKDPAAGREDPFASSAPATAGPPPAAPAPAASLTQNPPSPTPRATQTPPSRPVVATSPNPVRATTAGRTANASGLQPFAPTPAPAPAANRIVVRAPGNGGPAANASGSGDALEANGSSGGGAGSYIRIQVGPPQGAAAVGERVAVSPPAAQPAPEANPVQRAQTLQTAGRYREAVAAYEVATASLSGMALGDAFQGLALCHQRLGDTSAARSAYQQALATYQTQIAGKNAAAARRAITSCEAALEVLGNG